MSDWTSIEHEVELGVIIGRQAFNVPAANVLPHYVAGYCLALDMTAKDFLIKSQAKTNDFAWSVAKGFDTACPVSEFIPKQSIADPHNVDLWLEVNGEMRQNANTKLMIFDIPAVVSYLSTFFTLYPGDLILTGTPAGIGEVKRGDVIKCGLRGIKEMKFTVE